MAIGGIIPNGNVATGLIGHMHLMTLLAKTNQRAAHADDVVVRVRTKNNDSLGKLVAASRVIAAGSIGFCTASRLSRLAARPAGDGALESTKNINVQVVGTPALREQFLESMLVVVFVGQLQNWFL